MNLFLVRHTETILLLLIQSNAIIFNTLHFLELYNTVQVTLSKSRLK